MTLGLSVRWAEGERCARCGVLTKPWDSYGTRRRAYCLRHVPLFYRLRDRWREWRRP